MHIFNKLTNFKVFSTIKMHIKTAFLTFYMYSYKFTLLFLDVHHKMMHIK